MLRATLKSLLARKLRLILSGLAVLLGVMFVSGSFVLTDSLGRSFDNMFANSLSGTDVIITAEILEDVWQRNPALKARVERVARETERTIQEVVRECMWLKRATDESGRSPEGILRELDQQDGRRQGSA